MAPNFIAFEGTMNFFPSLGSARVRLAAGFLAVLGAVACGGRSRDGAAAAGFSGTGGASGGVEHSGGFSARGGQASAGQTSGGTGAASSAGQASVSGAGGESAGWTLPHTSDRPWRQSSEPLCAPEGMGLPWDLWSDERGVYVLGEIGARTTRLYFNDGTGWSVINPGQGNSFGLAGFSNGPLVLYAGSPCAVVFQDGDAEACASTLPSISDVFVVDPTRIFALAGNRVLRYNGDYFTQYGKPLPADEQPHPYHLWADAEVVITAGERGHVFVLPDANAEVEVLTVPDGAEVSSLWAFGRDDIWVGLQQNRLAHYDGASWTVQRVSDSMCGSVTSLWGSDQVLFFAGSSGIGKIEGGVLHTLAASSGCGPEGTMPGSWEELNFRKIWGNSASEVFFAVTERKLELTLNGESLETSATNPDACGMQRLYWYDGVGIRPL
jgi:hypothetical protein